MKILKTLIASSLLMLACSCFSAPKNTSNIFEGVYIDIGAGYGMVTDSEKVSNGFMTSFDAGYSITDSFALEIGIDSFPNIGDMSFIGGDNYIIDFGVKEKFHFGRVDLFAKFQIGDFYSQEDCDVAILFKPGVAYKINNGVKFTVQEIIAAPYGDNIPWTFGTILGLNISL